MAKGLGTTQRALLIAAARLTIAEVDRQAGRRALGITLPILSMEQMLQDACEHGLLNAPREPRRGDRKRLKTNETSRKILDRWYNPSHVAASLEIVASFCALTSMCATDDAPVLEAGAVFG
jgi:hypothetical protein